VDSPSQGGFATLGCVMESLWDSSLSSCSFPRSDKPTAGLASRQTIPLRVEMSPFGCGSAAPSYLSFNQTIEVVARLDQGNGGGPYPPGP